MIKKFLTLLIPIFIISCSTDVKDGIDESDDLGHDSWAKVIFTFTEGEMVDNVFKGYKNVDGLKFKTVQEFRFESDNLDVIPKGERIKLVKGQFYGLTIKYYNKHNKLINRQFTTLEMAPIHQHFFISSEKSYSTLKQTKKYTIDYTYRDTNHTNKMLGEPGVSIRDNDPIGLKGYFNVIKDAPYDFDMNVVLVHVLGRNKFNQDGSARPFYRPTIHMIGVTDFRQIIPMKIFTDKNSKTYIKDIATEFNITQEKAKQELDKRKLGSLQL